MKNNHTPEVRFAGYAGDWEERKLGEVFEQTSEYVNPKVENLELWSLTVEKGLTPKTKRYNREFLVKKEDQFKSVSDNEFIYNPMNMTLGAVDLNLTGKKVAVSGYYITMKTTDNYDSKYFGIWLKTPLAIKMYKLFATGSLIERQRVQFQTLSQIKASVPSKKEQAIIGDFFKQLDDTIALHQQELTTLEQTKQGFLQKMFPKEGESVPEIRFPGFTGEWEKRKLKDLAVFSKGYGYSKSDLIDEGKPVILYGRLYTKYETVIEFVDTFTTEKEKSVISKGTEVIVPSSGETAEDIARASAVSKPGIILGGDLNIVRPRNEIDPVFLALTISNGKQQKELSKRAQGKSVVHLHNSDLKDVNLLFPKKEEQIKIGNFFKQLDDTITLHQRELDALKEMKKAFLQKMFV